MTDHIPDAGKMVPEDVLRMFLAVYHGPPLRGAIYSARQALAAVAPLIAKAERERCALVALRYPISEDEHVVSAHGRAMQSMAIAAAIRALD